MQTDSTKRSMKAGEEHLPSAEEDNTRQHNTSENPDRKVYPDVTPPPEKIPGRLIASIISVGMVSFIGILVETLTSVLFPVIMAEFGVGTSTVQWLTTGYLLVVSLIVPLSSYIKRKFKLRTVFLAAVTLCIIGCIVAACSASFPMLLAARILQGLETGLAMPLMFNIILEQSPRSHVGQIMGVGGLVISVAPALGPAVGGLVGTYMPWRLIFVILIPFLAIPLVAGYLSIRQVSRLEAAQFTVLQAAALMVSFVTFIFAVNKGGQAAVAVSSRTPGAAADGIAAAALMTVSIAAAGIFAWMSQRSFSPLIRLGVFRSITFRWALAAYILMQICQISFGYVIPNSAQLGFGASALVGGFLILPGALFGAFLAPWAGSLLDKYGPKRPVLSAMVLTFAGVLLFMVFITPGSPVYLLGIFYFVFMMGYSMSFANSMTCALNTLDPEFKADGNAVFNSFNQLAGALGTTLMSALVSISQAGLAPETQQYQIATVRGSHWCYIVMVAAIGCSIVCLIRAFSGRRESRSQKGRDSDKIADDRVQYPGNN